MYKLTNSFKHTNPITQIQARAQTGRHAHKVAGTHTNRQAPTQTGRQAHKQTGRHTNKQARTQTNRHAHRQTGTHTNKYTHTNQHILVINDDEPSAVSRSSPSILLPPRPVLP